ncbi:serine-rich adhesin for platelets-like [Mercenaria mercenaria]|uniref:serine-rich adhesin for platelets-like n=1 Tax=Mercenaria mercenaria TaxID=6596 RepID=UPI00234E67F8|nr:serine-rich adhesin for platelets-like [Mercenaria mercenaria]
MKTFKPVPNFSFLLFIFIIECMQFAMCLNMWTSLEQKQASNKTPVKRCVSPCRIFHSWCKNEGKCREKGRDCTWYCECPSNCEGFFCEKKVEKDATAAGGGQSVEVKISYEKEKKKPVSAFDKSKLAQALAGIFLKEKQTDEEKKTILPDAIERVGKTIKTKENVTAKVIINCPPGDLYPKAKFNQITDSTTKSINVNGSNTQNHSNMDSESVSRPTENAASGVTHYVTTNAPEHPTVVRPGASQSTSTQSTVTPLVKSSFSVTSSTTEVTEAIFKHNTTAKSLESLTNTQTKGSTLHKTADSSTVKSDHLSLESSSESPTGVSIGEKKTFTSSTMSPTSIKITVSQFSTEADSKSTTTTEMPQNNNKNSKDITPPVENSLYIKKTDVRKISDKPDLLNIIEKAIEVEFISTTKAKQPSASPIKPTTESMQSRKNNDVTTENNNLRNTTKQVHATIHSAKSQTTENNTFLRSTSSPIASSTSLAKSTTAEKTRVTKTVNDLIKINTSVSSNITNIQHDIKSNDMVESSITNQPLKEQNISGTLQIPNTTNMLHTKQNDHTSDEGVLTTKETKSKQITTGDETYQNPADVLKQINPKSTTPQVERPTNDQTTHVISEASSTTIFKTKFDTTTTKTTTKFDAASKTPKFPANKKSYLSKQQVTENSTGMNKSTRDTIATGEINTLSSTNVPPVNLSHVITMSHDLPKISEVDMSTVQTVMSKGKTTEQQISSKSSENITESTTSPPAMKQDSQSSPPQTTQKTFKETSTAAPTSIQSNQPTRQVKSTQTVNTHTTEGSSMIKKQIQTVMSKEITTEQQIANKSSEKIKESTTSPPKMKQDTQSSPPQTTKKTFKETSTAAPTSIQSNQPTRQVKSTQTVNTHTTEGSSMIKKQIQTVMSKEITTEQQIANKSSEKIKESTTSPPKLKQDTQSSPPQIAKKTFKETSTTAPTSSQSNQPTRQIKNTQPVNTQTTEESNMIKTQTELHNNDSKTSETTTAGRKPDNIKQTAPVAYPSQTEGHQSNIHTLNKTTSNKVQISTSHYHETTTEQKHTVPHTTPGTTSSATSTKVNVYNPDVVENSSTTVSGKQNTVTGTTQTLFKSTDSTSNKAARNASPSVADDTGQQKDKNNPAAESVTQTDITTKAQPDKHEHTTASVIYSAGIGESKMSLTKAFLDTKSSELLKKSKVKNELLSNKLSESVKDLKFDLLKMGLRDKGLPSDLDNIL